VENTHKSDKMVNTIAAKVHERSEIGSELQAPPQAENTVRRREVHLYRVSHYSNRYSSGNDSHRNASTWSNVKPEIDIPDRHELFLLGDGERKVEMETVTRKSRPYRIAQHFLISNIVYRGRKRRSFHL
jgi:hypothetical protein